jgi:hypothetical protein
MRPDDKCLNRSSSALHRSWWVRGTPHFGMLSPPLFVVCRVTGQNLNSEYRAYGLSYRGGELPSLQLDGEVGRKLG